LANDGSFKFYVFLAKPGRLSQAAKALMAVVLAAEVEVGEQTYVQNVRHIFQFF